MLNITNFKISLKVLPICLDTVCDIAKKSNICFKRYNNFLVLQNKFTYIIFKNRKGSNTHINVTKLRIFEDIKESQKFLFSNFLNRLNSNIIFDKIDNITASYDLKKNIDIHQTIQNFKNLCEVRYNNETFPGVFLKHVCGTIIIFHSGKTILIGSKNITSLQCLINFLNANT
jgi:hypothetical protein